MTADAATTGVHTDHVSAPAVRRTRAKRGSGDLLRNEIVVAAKRLLAEAESADDVPMRAVADAVGVTTPSIYLHFADKQELLAAVVADVFGELDVAMTEAAATETTPLDRLRAFGLAYVRFALDHPEHYRLAMLEQVAKEGRWSQDDAKTVLVLLYTREKRYADVLTLTRELSAKYPRNYLLRLETADALVSLAGVKRKEKDIAGAVQAEKEAFATFDELLRDRNVRDSAARSLDLIHFKYGEALSIAGYNERAAKAFLAATKVDRAEPGLITMAHLYAARSYDVAGKRDEALAQYKEVLARPNVYDAHDEAKRGLRQAYKVEQARLNTEQ